MSWRTDTARVARLDKPLGPWTVAWLTDQIPKLSDHLRLGGCISALSGALFLVYQGFSNGEKWWAWISPWLSDPDRLAFVTTTLGFALNGLAAAFVLVVLARATVRVGGLPEADQTAVYVRGTIMAKAAIFIVFYGWMCKGQWDAATACTASTMDSACFLKESTSFSPLSWGTHLLSTIATAGLYALLAFKTSDDRELRRTGIDLASIFVLIAAEVVVLVLAVANGESGPWRTVWEFGHAAVSGLILCLLAWNVRQQANFRRDLLDKSRVLP